MTETNATVEPQEEVEEILEGQDATQPEEAAEDTQEESGEEEVIEEKAKEEEKEEKEQKEQKRKKTADERVKEIARRTWELRETERRIKAEREALEAAKKDVAAIKEPNIDDYDDHEKFVADTKVYYQKKADIDAREKAEKIAAANKRQSAEAEAGQRWAYEKEKELEKNPDFQTNELRVSRVLELYQATHIAQALLESEDGVSLVNHLAKNPEIAEEIAQMPQIKGVVELGKVAARLTQKPAKKKVSQAPPPVQKEKGGGGAQSNWANMSQADFNRKMNQL